MPRFVDLSHAIADGMDAYPGLPSPRIGAHLDHESSREEYAGKANFCIGHVDMVGNVGTYIDSPYHRYPDKADLSALPVDAMAGLPGLIVEETGDRAIMVDLSGQDIAGRAVLFHTGWDARWGTPGYWDLGPFIAEQTVTGLIEGGAALVGIDAWNVDDTEDPARPVHTRLLAEGILVVEHLCNLDALPGEGFRFSAVPPAIVGAPSFPVRAYAEVF